MNPNEIAFARNPQGTWRTLRNANRYVHPLFGAVLCGMTDGLSAVVETKERGLCHVTVGQMDLSEYENLADGEMEEIPTSTVAEMLAEVADADFGDGETGVRFSNDTDEDVDETEDEQGEEKEDEDELAMANLGWEE